MLCSNCNHKHYDYCEDCMECDLFEDELPEEYERKDECGCIFNERTIVSRLKAKEEQEIKFFESIAEAMAEDCNIPREEIKTNESAKESNRENARLLG